MLNPLVPQLFEVSEDGRLIVGPGAFMIEETKDILDKYELNAEPYLAYCHLMSIINSPLRNLPELEKRETAIIEIYTNIGEFDEDDPLLDRCIKKLKSLYSSPLYLLIEGMEEEMHNMRYYLKTTPYSSDDVMARKAILQDMGKISASYITLKKQVEEEFKDKTRGDQEAGSIR